MVCNLKKFIRNKKMKDKIVFGNIIGKGGYSTVYHCIVDEQEVVSKVVNKGEENIFRNEVNILEKLNHKYIIKPLKVIDMMLITEFKGNDLFFWLEEGLIEDEKIKILWQLVEAIKYIHSKNVCHLDLKLENIIYNGDSITIIDFGLSHAYNDEKNFKILQKRCGTKHYVPPEVYNRKIYDGFEADMWSFGIVTFALFLNFFPYFYPSFQDPGFLHIMQKSIESLCCYYNKIEKYKETPKFVIKIIGKLLKPAGKRYTIQNLECLLHYHKKVEKK